MKPNNLLIYNSLSRNKEIFRPIHEGRVGMYVCGPTVYGDGHLGHARPAITFDVLFRYLTWLGYKVRYVRNIMTPTRGKTKSPKRRVWNSWSLWRSCSITSTVTTRRWNA